MSIVAGMPVERLQQGFNTKVVVRCMPNTPATVGEGMTVWFSSKEVPEDIEQMAKGILRCAGTDTLLMRDHIMSLSLWPIFGFCLVWCILCSVSPAGRTALVMHTMIAFSSATTPYTLSIHIIMYYNKSCFCSHSCVDAPSVSFDAGDEVKVTDEHLIDMATAISGTGPAVS